MDLFGRKRRREMRQQRELQLAKKQAQQLETQLRRQAADMLGLAVQYAQDRQLFGFPQLSETTGHPPYLCQTQKRHAQLGELALEMVTADSWPDPHHPRVKEQLATEGTCCFESFQTVLLNVSALGVSETVDTPWGERTTRHYRVGLPSPEFSRALAECEQLHGLLSEYQTDMRLAKEAQAAQAAQEREAARLETDTSLVASADFNREALRQLRSVL